jgi:hypothetical protein
VVSAVSVVTLGCQLGRNDVSTSLKTRCKWIETTVTKVTATVCQNVYWIQVADNWDKRYDFAEVTKGSFRYYELQISGMSSPHSNEEKKNFTSLYQGEHKVFPLLQRFISRKLHGIKTYFFLNYSNVL